MQHALTGMKLFTTVFIFTLWHETVAAKDSSATAPASCYLLKDALSIAVSNFMSCYVKSSRPFTLCHNCALDYLILQREFSTIMNSSVSDVNGVKCASMLLASDQVQLLLELHTFATQMWTDRAHCHTCFKSMSLVKNDSAVKLVYSDTVTQIFPAVTLTVKCLSNFTNYPWPIHLKHFELENAILDRLSTDCANYTFHPSACSLCETAYRTMMSVFHRTLKEDKKKNEMCMDVYDLVNTTSRLYSSCFSCLSVEPSWYWGIAPLICSLLIILIFYCSIFCITQRHPSTFHIYRPGRLSSVPQHSINIHGSVCLHNVASEVNITRHRTYSQ